MPHNTSIAARIAHLVGPGKLRMLNGRLAFSAKSKSPLRLDPSRLEVLNCYGKISVTDQAMSLLLNNHVEVAFLTAAGFRCHGRLTGNHDSATSLRMCQHQALSDENSRLTLAKEVVVAKINSQQHAARHFQRQGDRHSSTTIRQLKSYLQPVRSCSSINQLLGYEGTCSEIWFRFFADQLNQPWSFPRRQRRPPKDPVNGLLSLGYTWLLNKAVAKLQARGLEVNLGALHAYRPGRPSLACDVIESFRVPAVDRWVINVCKRSWLSHEDFEGIGESVKLTKAAFGRVLSNWETHWEKTQQDRSIDRYIDHTSKRFRELAELLRRASCETKSN